LEIFLLSLGIILSHFTIRLSECGIKAASLLSPVAVDPENVYVHVLHLRHRSLDNKLSTILYHKLVFYHDIVLCACVMMCLRDQYFS
jgi:hypothetical protein